MKTHLTLIVLACLAAGLFTNDAAAQTSSSAGAKNSPIANKAGITKLRDLFFVRDFGTGYETGQKLLKQFPGDDELRMWTVLNGVRSTENSKAALEMAKEMAARSGENIYALIALSMAYSYTGNAPEALKAAESAVKLAPDNEEAIFCYNTAVFRAGRYADSVAWLDKNDDRIKDRSRFFNSRALSNFQSGKKEKAFEDFAASLTAGAPTVNSLFLYADYLNREKRTKDAIPLIKKALQMAPGVLASRVAYWRMVYDQTDKPADQKDREVIADMNAAIKADPNSPELLYNVALQYATMKNVEKEEFYKAQILKKFPGTSFAESILIEQIMDKRRAISDRLPAADFIRKSGEFSEARLLGDRELLNASLSYFNPDKKESDSIDEAWRSFIRRPRHYNTNHLGTAYSALFSRAMFDFQLSDPQLKELLDAVKKYRNDRNSNTNTEIADFLAARKVFGLNPTLTADMLSYARAGIAESEMDIADFRGVLNGKDLENQAKYIRTRARQVLGLALYVNGQFDEAEKELLKAYEIDNENTDIFLTMALIYKARKEFEKAEDVYLKYATISRPLMASITDLYKAKNGGLSGFDAYYKDVKEKIRARTMTEIAASRIKEPKGLVPFNLKTIDQRSISFADVKGKVVVINFWGVWCGPCVKEMPEVQELAAKYWNDNDVAILTFDARDDLATVKKFIADKKYDFPVLVADSYIDGLKAPNDEIEAFPTTYFVDRNGKISFLKVGNSGNLVEEFSLRIDILKQDK